MKILPAVVAIGFCIGSSLLLASPADMKVKATQPKIKGRFAEVLGRHDVSFDISNPGETPTIVDSLSVVVTEVVDGLRIYTFPWGPFAPIDRYEEEVYLEPHKGTFEIRTEGYQLKPSETNGIDLRIHSDTGYRYLFFVRISGYDIARPKDRITRETPSYSVEFPEHVEYTTLMRNAEKSVFFLLEGGAASDVIGSSYEFLLSSQLDIRFIVDPDYLYELGEFEHWIHNIDLTSGRNIIKSSSQEVWDIGYDRFRTDEIGRGMRQCIVFDRKQVLCGDGDLKVSFEEGGKELTSLVKKFDDAWKAPNYYTREEYRSAYQPTERGPLERRRKSRIPRRTGREAEYYFLLRSCLEEPCIDELLRAAKTGKGEAGQVAIDSLKSIREHLYSSGMDEKKRKAVLEKIDHFFGK